MKVSYNWLKQYVNVNLPADEVANMLTEIGLEVEHVEKTQQVEGGLAGLVVGHVLTAEKHPGADKLKVTTVDIGTGEPLPIVCGAPNVAAGQKVIVATVGATLFPVEGDSFKIKKSKIRGEASQGMICAEDEIGIGKSHDGIIVLDNAIAAGTPAAEVFELKEDYLFEIGLTPNRSDATCHLGVAQDLYAALVINKNFKGEVKMPSVTNFKVDNTNQSVNISVEDVELCPRYAGICISNITVKESPEWLKERLQSIGINPKNNIVDITNFILHELGQPLHAFDAKEVNGEVVVKMLPEGTKFTTLDEVERELSEADLMICNADKPMCIAGVFGGVTSGVKETTTDIFLESACFNAQSIRKTGKRHNLRTDACMRYEKGGDPNVAIYALKRAAILIKELAGGTISSDIIDLYPNPIKKAEVTVSYKQVSRITGVEIASEKVDAILAALEMETVNKTDETITIKVPTNKVDVLREIDVIEEILRIYGFNNIPVPSNVNSALAPSPAVDKNKLQNQVSDYLVANGFSEAMANSISNSKYYDGDELVVPLLNSLSVELDVLRKNMLFSGLNAIELNQNKSNHDLRFFEFGKTYEKADKGHKENSYLSIFIVGNKANESWQAATENTDFFDLKKTVINVLKRIGAEKGLVAESINDEELIYGLQMGLPKNAPILKMGRINGTLQKKFGIKPTTEIYYALINWKTALKRIAKKKITYTPTPKFPATRRDLALLIDKKVNFADIEKIARKNGKKILQSVNLFDIYEDAKKIGDNKKSYAVSFVFQDESKTLTDKEIDKIMSRMIETYQKELGATLR
ncbi:UNVERIFIED_CONTAM: hypothetical protein GTU68_007405 [Idotea baltica]|nr:hypothetical protein [Idotea baltica]